LIANFFKEQQRNYFQLVLLLQLNKQIFNIHCNKIGLFVYLARILLYISHYFRQVKSSQVAFNKNK